MVAILLRLVGGTKKDTFCNGVFIRMEIRGVSNTKTVKNPRSGQIFSLEPLCTSRESSTKKVSINRLYVQLSLRCLNKFCFFVNGALISFISKFDEVTSILFNLQNQTFYMVPQGHFSYPDPFYVSVCFKHLRCKRSLHTIKINIRGFKVLVSCVKKSLGAFHSTKIPV